MELILFYITAPLSIVLLGILLARHEKLGAHIAEKEAFKRESAELREKLKKEADDFNHLLNHLRAYYEDRVERNEEKIKKSDTIHGSKWDEAIDLWLTFRPEWRDSQLFKITMDKVERSLRAQEPKTGARGATSENEQGG